MIHTNIPNTCEPYLGFYGTLEDLAEPAWHCAMRTIHDATDQPLTAIRRFLDSRFGALFAKQVLSHLKPDLPLERAIQGVTNDWCLFEPRRSYLCRQFGVSQSTSRLVAYITLCERMFA